MGIIGLDTSHAIAFTEFLNAEDAPPDLAGCRVVAAYPQGSPDIESGVRRVPYVEEDIRRLGVEIVDSIDELLQRVDAVLLETTTAGLTWSRHGQSTRPASPCSSTSRLPARCAMPWPS